MNNTVSHKRSTTGSRVLTAVFIAFLCLGVAAGIQIFTGWYAYYASDREYEQLRQLYEPAGLYAADPATDTGPGTTDADGLTMSRQDPADVNPDYVGWLKISGTTISYPVVQAGDNEKYLNTSFEGNRNRLGAVFMDYRCREDSRHIILYGHNGRNGAMFGSLQSFLSTGYRNNHREISFMWADGTTEVWQVFSASQMDATDAVYPVEFRDDESFRQFAESLAAPEGARRIITLSTCTEGVDSGRRLILHGAVGDGE